MRPVTKVLLVLAVVALSVGVIWFASQKWGKKPDAVVAKGPSAQKSAAGDSASTYNDPVSMYERWRKQLSGADSTPPVPPAPRPRNDLASSSENEGTIVAHRSEEAVAGADPPGPTLRPTGVDGEVVTKAWKPRDNPAANSYTIAAGDTLYGIAMKFYGDTRYASAIEAANPGINPSALRIGERLTLPEKTPEPKAGATPAEPQGKVYVVQKNDTLIGISRRFYGDATMYKKIYEANKDVLSSASATLHVGERLRLPEK